MRPNPQELTAEFELVPPVRPRQVVGVIEHARRLLQRAVAAARRLPTQAGQAGEREARRSRSDTGIERAGDDLVARLRSAGEDSRGRPREAKLVHQRIRQNARVAHADALRRDGRHTWICRRRGQRRLVVGRLRALRVTHKDAVVLRHLQVHASNTVVAVDTLRSVSAVSIRPQAGRIGQRV